MSDKGKKAILLVGLGAAYQSAREKTYDAIFAEVKTEFPEYDVRQAWTSPKIIQKVYEREGIHISTVEEAIAEMANNNVRVVFIQPVLFLEGAEYQAIQKGVEKCRKMIPEIYVGKPLLNCAENITKTAAAVLEQYTPRPDSQMLLLIGQRGDGVSYFTYDRLEGEFEVQGDDHILIGTLQGKRTIEYVAEGLKRSKKTDVLMAPLMITANHHAFKQMVGPHPDAWKNQLEERGFNVTVDMSGLAENQKVRNLIIEGITELINARG